MKYATEEMHRQLIALTSTSVDRRRLDQEKLQLAMSDPGTYCERFAEWINSWRTPLVHNPVDEEVIKYLQPVSSECSVTIYPTDGTGTFVSVAHVFTSHLDPNFEREGTNVRSTPTKLQSVSVLEMIHDGAFEDVFNSLGVDLDPLCLTQDQIIQFVTNNRNMLHPRGLETFFLFKVGNRYFVTSIVIRGHGKLRADLYPFHSKCIYGVEGHRRFVIPKPVTLTA